MHYTRRRKEGGCESGSESVRFIIRVSRDRLDKEETLDIERNAGNKRRKRTRSLNACSKTDGDNGLFLEQLLDLNIISVKQVKLTHEF